MSYLILVLLMIYCAFFILWLFKTASLPLAMHCYSPLKDEAQTASFKGPARTAL
jgi:hypothetical protein